MDKEEHIIRSWQANAAGWIDIVQSGGIESRKLITDKAIIEAVVAVKPTSVLDIGCGEGWLAKQLHDQGIRVSGVDIVPAFIEKAKEKVPGEFFVASYEDIASKSVSFSSIFDAIVINFASLGKESTENLLSSLPQYLNGNGKLFIQTLHPYTRKEIEDYTSGWKPGNWEGLPGQFTMPYQWYFRTMEDWTQLLADSGFYEVHITETKHPVSGKLSSVIFTCSI
jgi:2-polyprenyl-3-methyl-5-hydroxy-6-metoxy-1,4-benzoquinol methylase